MFLRLIYRKDGFRCRQERNHRSREKFRLDILRTGMNNNAFGQEPMASSRLIEFCESEACQSALTWLLCVESCCPEEGTPKRSPAAAGRTRIGIGTGQGARGAGPVPFCPACGALWRLGIQLRKARLSELQSAKLWTPTPRVRFGGP